MEELRGPAGLSGKNVGDRYERGCVISQLFSLILWEQNWSLCIFPTEGVPKDLLVETKISTQVHMIDCAAVQYIE